MSSLGLDNGELLLSPRELETLASLSGGDATGRLDDVASLRNLGALDATDRPIAGLRTLASTVARPDTTYTYTCVEQDHTQRYGVWVGDSSLVGHALPATEDDKIADLPAPVLFTPRERLNTVVLSLADIPARVQAPAQPNGVGGTDTASLEDLMVDLTQRPGSASERWTIWERPCSGVTTSFSYLVSDGPSVARIVDATRRGSASVSGTTPLELAACLVLWVAGDVSEVASAPSSNEPAHSEART